MGIFVSQSDKEWAKIVGGSMDQSSFLGNLAGTTQHSKNVGEKLREVRNWGRHEKRRLYETGRRETMEFNKELARMKERIEEQFMNKYAHKHGEEKTRELAQKRFEEEKKKRERIFDKEQQNKKLKLREDLRLRRKEAIAQLREQYARVGDPYGPQVSSSGGSLQDMGSLSRKTNLAA